MTARPLATAEDTIPTLVQQTPIADDVAAVVGFIRNHDDHRVTANVIESTGDRTAEAQTTSP